MNDKEKANFYFGTSIGLFFSLIFISLIATHYYPQKNYIEVKNNLDELNLTIKDNQYNYKQYQDCIDYITYGYLSTKGIHSSKEKFENMNYTEDSAMFCINLINTQIK